MAQIPAKSWINGSSPVLDGNQTGKLKIIANGLTQNVKRHLFAVGFFIFLTALFMGPAIINPTKILYGNPGTPFTAVWWAWWCKYSSVNGLEFLRPSLQGAPFGADYSHYPFQTMFWLYKYLFIYIGDIAAYNIIIFGGFYFSALSAYALAYFVTKDMGAGVIAGTIFSFSPFHLMQSTMNLWLATSQWIPLYFMLLLALLSQSFYKRDGRIYTPLFCSLLFALVVFENYYYGYMAFLLTALVFCSLMIWQGLNHKIKNFKIRPWIQFCTFCVLLITPFMVTILLNLQAAKHGLINSQDYIRPLSQISVHGAKLIDYYLPPTSHPIWGKVIQAWVKAPNSNGTWNERTLFVGIVPFLLAAYGLYHAWRGRINDPIKQLAASVFGIILILALLLSFHSNLTLAGIDFSIVSRFLSRLFPMFRVYSRFGLFVMLSISILAALGVQELTAKRRSWRSVIKPLVVFLVILEFMNFPPYPVVRADKIPRIYEWLHDQPGKAIVVEYPIAEYDTYEHFKYLFWQRYHQKPLFNGIRPGTEGYGNIVTAKSLNKDSVDVLSRLGIKYVIIDHKFDVEENSLKIKEGSKPYVRVEKHSNIPDGLVLVKVFDQQSVYEIVH